jgi:GNAT superfamily N-acetyltransferase
MITEMRKADENDFEAIHRLIQEFAFFMKTPDKVSVTVEQMIRDKDYFQYIVAIEKERIIGFASYFLAYYSWTGKALYLDDLYVQEECRGKQVGTNLLNAVLDIARDEKCPKVRWQVSNWNSKAINFYKKYRAEIDNVEINCDLKL